jgi:YesN/AraC family two-component response regulator
MMPIMDGYQLLEKVKKTPELRHIPIIMLTARAGLDDKLKALRIGVDDYLNKPFNEEELLVRIENLIENSKNKLPQTVETSDTSDTPKQDDAPSNKDLLWLEKVEAEVLNGITQFEFSIETLAATLTTNRWQLSKRLKALTGLTTNQYIQEVRLNHARTLLEAGQVDSIKTLAYEVGMKDSQYFSRLFKKRFGRNPSSFL